MMAEELDAGALWLSIQRILFSHDADRPSERATDQPSTPTNSLIELMFVRLIVTNMCDPVDFVSGKSEKHVLTLLATLRAT
jgi:hypothetical protein